MTHSHQWAIKTLVPEEVYTDRQFFLDYFYQAALKARTRRTMSTVLLGQRRMGKTEIFRLNLPVKKGLTYWKKFGNLFSSRF